MTTISCEVHIKKSLFLYISYANVGIKTKFCFQFLNKPVI